MELTPDSNRCQHDSRSLNWLDWAQLNFCGLQNNVNYLFDLFNVGLFFIEILFLFLQVGIKLKMGKYQVSALS